MHTAAGLIDAIGHTPLIRLRRASESTGCEIYGKAEFMNPGGSVKDRAARGIVLDAERRGLLLPGGTVVEGTAGNTGIGLAHVCGARGYQCVIVMPDNQSPEKYSLLEALGAQVHRVKTVPYSDPNHFQRVAGRMASELPNAYWANQFDNPANRRAHVETTGPEIWEQTGGRIDAFVAASGTGGTLAGVAEFLKSKSSKVRTVLADPPGSALYEFIRNGALKATGYGFDHRGHRHRPGYRQPAGCAHRRCPAHRRLRQRRLRLSAAARRRVVPGQHQRRQCRGGDAPGSAAWSGPSHSHRVVRFGAKYLTRLFNREWLAQKGLLAAALGGAASQ